MTKGMIVAALVVLAAAGLFSLLYTQERVEHTFQIERQEMRERAADLYRNDRP